MEIMLTIASITAISGLSALGIAALPWTDREVQQSLGAMRAVPEAIDRASQHVGPVTMAVVAR